MEFLHYDFNLKPEDTVEVTLDHAANVQLLDEANYQNYRQGRRYDYFGGYVTNSPYRIKAPRSGKWHLVIDLGGGAGSVKASARVVTVSPLLHALGQG